MSPATNRQNGRTVLVGEGFVSVPVSKLDFDRKTIHSLEILVEEIHKQWSSAIKDLSLFSVKYRLLDSLVV